MCLFKEVEQVGKTTSTLVAQIHSFQLQLSTKMKTRHYSNTWT